MAMLRATFFFEDTNKHGWSETIFNTRSDLSLAAADAARLFTFRRNLLGDTAFLTFIRISDDDVKRDSLIVPIPAGDIGSRTSAGKAADIANTCLVTRIEAAPTVRRTLYLRGIPDDCVTRSGLYTPTQGFAQDFQEWAKELVLSPWACRTKDNLIPVVQITAQTFDPTTGVVTMTTAANHGFAIGNSIQISGVRGNTQTNGRWNVWTIPTLTTFTIKVNVLLPGYDGGGQVSRVGFKLVRIMDAVVRRASHRITGGPFDRPVGRRRSKARR